MGSSVKKQRKKLQRAQKSKATEYAQDYELYLDYLLRYALEGIEGDVPEDEMLIEHGARYIDEHENTLLFWKGEHILTVSKPVIHEGKMKCGVDTHYEVKTDAA